MNERLIGDLFAEATQRMTGSSSREFSQKFAELIVGECVNIADEYDGVGSTIVSRIKQHFGVEE